MVPQDQPELKTLLEDEGEIASRLRSRRRLPTKALFYSSLLRAWTASPLGALVGLDDHGFHRGDGVFEAIKLVNGKLYLLNEHLLRLQRSGQKIGLQTPVRLEGIQEILNAGIRHWGAPEGLVRIFVTRGAGGFSVDPSESLGPEIYIAMTPLRVISDQDRDEGLKLGVSQIPAKPDFFAGIKSLNYLPNVLMKAEATRRGFDFCVGQGANSELLEGPTENLIWINPQGELCQPRHGTVLPGCTMARIFELVENSKLLPVRRDQMLFLNKVFEQKELMICGTTWDIYPVKKFGGVDVQTSHIWKKILALLREDQR